MRELQLEMYGKVFYFILLRVDLYFVFEVLMRIFDLYV